MAKHDPNLENKTTSKIRYLLPNRSQNIRSTLPFSGQQDFHRLCTITLPNPPFALDKNFSPLQHSSLTRVKIWSQHMPPNFEVKCPFYFEINLLIMIMLPNGLLITAVSLPMRVVNQNLFFALHLSPPRSHNRNLLIHLPFFYPYVSLN